MTSSVLESSEEKINGFKLMRLIVDGGTEVLRNIFLSIHPGNLHAVLSTHCHTLYPLFKTKNIITQPQWDKLYPPPPRIPNIQEFDITLLVILLRNICGLSPPSTGWNVMPSSTDNSREANIVRIRLFRNNFFGHVPGIDVSRLDFEAYWVEVGSALRSLGLNQAEIDRLKAEECGEEEVKRVRKEWNESEKEVLIELGRLGKKIDESLKQVKSSTEGILCECLNEHDFKDEIQSFYVNYTKGTREWVFDQVSKWLNNKSSYNRAFIVSGQAGMGKSTIAAVTCTRFPEFFGACHFFQYNNSRYNNPKFLLQSLASQLCHVIPEYKQNLTNNLSGNKAQLLDHQNIEGMFSVLFQEPFSKISDPGKHFLIVIDALDECRQEEKHKLVDFIATYFHKFPMFIRFLITTRSETDIARKFQELNPLFLEPDDERNLKDLRHFFEDKLKTMSEYVQREELVEKLVKKSEGLMLYASFLCKLPENGSIISNSENLPAGIEEIYNRYFNRLESELRNLGIDEKQFLKFLSVIAVAKRPLPLALLERLLSSDKDLSIAGRTLRKLINCLSSVLVIKDESVSFFHKSVKDWLVITNHDFTIIETYGHRTLADICVFQMQTLKQNEVSSTFDLAIVYALQYGTQHVLEAEIKDVYFLTELINHVTDLEVVHAGVCSDIYTTLSNLSSLDSCNMHNSSICEETQRTIRTLIFIIRKFIYILKDVPQSFLQYVLNENDDVLSPKACALLMTRYRGLAYFESEDGKENIEKASIGRILTSRQVLDIDISPSEDFLICGYEKGVELFSLSDFKLLWKIDDFLVERRECACCFCRLTKPHRRIVFHPLKNIIFPGQLTRVLNLKGKFETGMLVCEEIPSKFTNCCFSHDNTKMITNYDIHLTVWNLLENKKIVSLSCRSELFSILFSANDRFIGTTNIDELCVYDTENSYSMVSRCCCGNIKVLVSPFHLDSWYCLVVKSVLRRKIEIVKYDLTVKPVREHFFMSMMPTNARAAAEFQAVMESEDRSWLVKVGCGSFFILSNGNVLVSSNHESEIKLFRLNELIQNSKTMQRPNLLLSLRYAVSCSVSVDGRYVYTHDSRGTLRIMKPQSVTFKILGLKKDNLIPFVPVANGVFFCGEVRNPLWTLFVGKNEFFAGIPELWNSEVTQRLASFPELTGTSHCLSVAQDLVACIMELQQRKDENELSECSCWMHSGSINIPIRSFQNEILTAFQFSVTI
ncbi:E3 ubiquitin- ligase DZIP3 [Paramuricea clavata]|uniref:E3 ubiquitin- ligase DZIP3 n=1 Tax=Paramuricea clavata TaxID=317549 RepID=A0A6S7I6K3_PARCT|nr:E3 ubiquitin- ligase DZIP3 [Paramuricea clavata]